MEPVRIQDVKKYNICIYRNYHRLFGRKDAVRFVDKGKFPNFVLFLYGSV